METLKLVLRDIHSVSNLSYNYVSIGFKEDKPVLV